MIEHNFFYFLPLLLYYIVDDFFQIDMLRAVLKKELEVPLIEIADKNACLDGGDVLFTGKRVTRL